MLSMSNPTLVTRQYAPINIAIETINIIEDTIGFLIFTSSFLRPAVNKSINLYFDTTVVLNIINIPNIIAK